MSEGKWQPDKPNAPLGSVSDSWFTLMPFLPSVHYAGRDCFMPPYQTLRRLMWGQNHFLSMAWNIWLPYPSWRGCEFTPANRVHAQVGWRKRPHEVLALGEQIHWANPHLFSASLHSGGLQTKRMLHSSFISTHCFSLLKILYFSPSIHG